MTTMILVWQFHRDQSLGLLYFYSKLMILPFLRAMFQSLLIFRHFSSQIREILMGWFADDVSVVVSALTLEELLTLCKLILQNFVNWCHKNNWMINIDKTKCIYFTISHSDRKLVIIHLDGGILSQNGTKTLGIQLDDKNKWDMFFDYVCKELNNFYYSLNRVRTLLSLESLISVYYSLVYSHLSFNIFLCGNSSNVERPFIVQKRILHMIFSIPQRSSCRPIFMDNYILNLSSIFILKCLLYVKENKQNIVQLSSFHNYNTRSKKTLFISKHRTTKFELSSFYQMYKTLIIWHIMFDLLL